MGPYAQDATTENIGEHVDIPGAIYWDHDSARRSPIPAHKIYSLTLEPKNLDDTDKGLWGTKRFK